MEENLEKKALIKLKASIRRFDADIKEATENIEENYFEEAALCLQKSLQNFDHAVHNHPDVLKCFAREKEIRDEMEMRKENFVRAEELLNECKEMSRSLRIPSPVDDVTKGLLDSAIEKISFTSSLKQENADTTENLIPESPPKAQPKIPSPPTKKRQKKKEDSPKSKVEKSPSIRSPPNKKTKTKVSQNSPPAKTKKTSPKKKKKYPCGWEGCDSSWDTPSKLNRHYNAVHLKLRIPCKENCGRSFADVDTMRDHVNSVHKNVRYKCTVCGASYVAKRDLDYHVATKHENRQQERFPCDLCTLTFARRRNMKNHRNRVHFGEKRFSCEECKKRFTGRVGMIDHLYGVHKKEARFKCKTCDNKFMYRDVVRAHEKPRSCFLCTGNFECSGTFMTHRNSHIMTCEVCEKIFCHYWKAHHHALYSHIRAYKCSETDCKAKFTSKFNVTQHLMNVHKLQKCLACPMCFKDEDEMLEHCKLEHPQSKCCFCTDESPFKYFSYKQLSTHIIATHSNIHHCISCGKFFSKVEDVNVHQCSMRYSPKELKMLNFIHQPYDGTMNLNVASIFTNDDGLIEDELVIFPPQCSLFFDVKLNKNEEHMIHSFYLNNDQHLFQLGSTAMLYWLLEVNSLAWVYEVIEFERTTDGALLMPPKFSRNGLSFTRDVQDVIFNVKTTRLFHPYDMGHARAAANCLTFIDFNASFSNLNFWPMMARLNRNSWKDLESFVRREAKKHHKASVVTGAIFLRKGVLVTEYVKGVYCPPAFYKCAAFHMFDGRLEIKCWIMYNTNDPQSIEDSEVSLMLLERATRTKFLTKKVLESLTDECFERHKNQLRRHDDYLGIR